MRARIIVPVIVISILILGPVLYFHLKPDVPAAEPIAAVNDQAAPTQALPAILKRASHDSQTDGLPTRSSIEPSAPMDHDTYVIQTSARLSELGSTKNPANLKKILSEMENPDPEIRQAALTATIDFGSKEAIPALQNELNWATDPQEKVNILKAIDFLQLPGMGDTASQSSDDGVAPKTN